MRKLWQAVMEARKEAEEKDIFLDVTDTSSPYGEATLKNVYSPQDQTEGRIAVNPFYSHQAVFGDLIKPGRIPELTAFLCDLILHHIAWIDSLEGMNLEEFYIRFLTRDIGQGAFGVLAGMDDFEDKEIRRIAYYYLRLCRTGCYENCFCSILQELFQGVWVSSMDDGSLLVVIGMERSEQGERKIRSLRHIFLQAGRKCRIYWNETPCIIGCGETPVGKSVLY